MLDKIGIPTMVTGVVTVVAIGAVVILELQGLTVPPVFEQILPLLIGALIGINVPNGRTGE